MKDFLKCFQRIGKFISKSIVKICLMIVYISFIALYSLFIRFNRQNIIIRNHIYGSSDVEKMF